MRIIETSDLSVEFKARRGLLGSVRVRALENVSIAVSRGESLAIVGESGSGKTTLARACLLLVKPNSGSILFDGEELSATNEKNLRSFRRKAQAIFQDPYSSLDSYMTIGQIVEEPLIIHQTNDRRTRRLAVEKALEEVRLSPGSDFYPKFPHMLSGGQRQRVAIARALVLEPDLIIADEPVSMVDASSKAEILYLMRELQEKHNTAFIYITHDIATAYHFSDRIAVMYAGHIVETGPTKEVISSPLHPYTRALVEAVPQPDPSNRLRKRAVIHGEPPSAVTPPTGCRFHPRCPIAFKGCDSNNPSLIEIKNSHEVACHLWSKFDAEAHLPSTARKSN